MTAPPHYSRARAAAHYGGIMRRLIVRFKFEDRHEPLPLFVTLMREAGKTLLQEADLIVPVPLHRLRLLQRRFNQAAILARCLGRIACVPAAVTLLERRKRTASQVGLSQDARLENVRDAFRVNPRYRDRLREKRLLLIDDVITTGATVNACAAALLEAGAARVDVLAVALVSPGFDDGSDDLALA
jgi:ComF family protein